MTKIKKLTIALFVLGSTLFLGGCAVNKKKKCDTCPKWDRYVLPEGHVVLEIR